MKKRFLLTAVLSVFFVGALHVSIPLEHAYAQGVSGDALCGGVGNPCTPEHFRILANKLFLLFASIGTALLFLFIISRIIYSAYLYMANNDPSALARARTQSFNMLIGYGIIIAVFGGLYFVGLKIFGVNESVLRLLQFFSSGGFIEHAYAQSTTLTNPLSSDNAYDIIIAGISLAMRFFIYPALLAMWVASGFKLVYSQGNPEGLKTARKWFLVSFMVTIIAFTLQGFIIAFRQTALKVFDGASTQNLPSNPSSTGAANGTAPYTVGRVTDCTGKPINTVCTVAGRDGLCGYSESGSYGCYVGACVGSVGLDGVCYSR